MLVDSCIGNGKTVEWFPAWHKKNDALYLSALSNHGIDPAETDYVLCTHLHVDHGGWNTRLRDGRWVQCLYPGWAFRFDDDRELTHHAPPLLRAQRRYVGLAILATHFPSPSVGHIRSTSRTFRYEFWSDGAA